MIIPQNIIIIAKKTLCQHVQNWKGVDTNKTEKKNIPRDLLSYKKIGRNWVDRKKAQWMGGCFFVPILHILFNYVQNITQEIAAQELIYFIILYQLMHTTVVFEGRGGENPLILDAAFRDSENLVLFLCNIGEDNGIEWIKFNKRVTLYLCIYFALYLCIVIF